MASIAYIDNIFKLSNAYVTKDYSKIREAILLEKELMDYIYEEDGIIFGYRVFSNDSVSKLYNINAKVVRFYFSNIDTLHNAKQEEILKVLFADLKKRMDCIQGYYNIRLPAHIVDAIKGFNEYVGNSIFCGGTVEQISHSGEIDIINNNNLKVFFADQMYIDKYKKELLNMTYSSFETYQGQYHISPFTDQKAGIIYEKWIEASFNKFKKNTILVVEYDSEPIGFCTIEEDEYAVEGQLSAISNKYRKLGGYRMLISTLINYANSNKKSFIASTQFDNYIVQGTWNSMGMKPYFSFYNFHYNSEK